MPTFQNTLGPFAASAEQRGAAVAAPGPGAGTSTEMRRFAAGMRALVAMLATLLLTGASQPMGQVAAVVMLGYALWAGWVLWAEATGRPSPYNLLHYWVDVFWSAAMLLLTTPGSHDMLILTLVQPVVLASIGYGVQRGVRLALFAALAVAVDGYPSAWRWSSDVGESILPGLGVLALVPAAALLARPMSVLRQRMALVGDIEASLDPRRGLQPVAKALVERLRVGTGAQVVGLVMPSASAAPAMLATAVDGGFSTSDEVHLRLEALLKDTPDRPLTHVRRRPWRPARGVRMLDGGRVPAGLAPNMDALADLLEVRTLVVVPLVRYGRRHGHLLLGLADAQSRMQELSVLAHAAPELLRIVEQAALVDQLQAESEAHERARIGRDLHDSAIQPYLGLKYAVECVALRIPPSNPARAEVDALATLVNGEVAALRELISGLRTQGGPGDNALVPAVRRQARRFALLFSIEVEIDCPDTLPTTRAQADALFHLVNETLNNIRKHSGARRAWLRLSADADSVHLTVRDDGGSLRGSAAGNFEPRSLNERVAELGGQLRIAQPDGLNTELQIRIPLYDTQEVMA